MPELENVGLPEVTEEQREMVRQLLLGVGDDATVSMNIKPKAKESEAEEEHRLLSSQEDRP